MEILLVEDDLEDAGMTIEALKSGDVPCRLTLVRDGEEALRFLRRHGIFTQAPRPDLVLLDMQMPKMDGREVLREIRGDDRLKELPVLVMTASRVHRAILEGEGLCVEGYMNKPVSFEQFIAAVKSLRRDLLHETVGPGRAGRPG
jgi:CheY-like chemotaxis protein